MYQDEVGDWEEAGEASYEPDEGFFEYDIPAEY